MSRNPPPFMMEPFAAEIARHANTRHREGNHAFHGIANELLLAITEFKEKIAQIRSGGPSRHVSLDDDAELSAAVRRIEVLL
jgi:hypothetical protein